MSQPIPGMMRHPQNPNALIAIHRAPTGGSGGSLKSRQARVQNGKLEKMQAQITDLAKQNRQLLKLIEGMNKTLESLMPAGGKVNE